jgi:hypothetical protein
VARQGASLMITTVEAKCRSCTDGLHEDCWREWDSAHHNDRVFKCVCSHTAPLPWVFNDGGRQAAGFKGLTNDCVVRSICIATQLPYTAVYEAMNEFAKGERQTKRMRSRSSSRTGVHKKTSKAFMKELGWSWFPTMGIGTGTTVHLRDGELPLGRLVVAVSKHYTAVIDGVIHDTHDPSRDGTRAVYGYYLPGGR